MESSHDPVTPPAHADVSRGPSGVLLAAALTGLLGAGCEGGAIGAPGPQGGESATAGAGGAPAGGTGGKTAGGNGGKTAGGGGEAAGGSGGSGPKGGGEGPEILDQVVGDRTFADVRAECEERGGFTQVHAACAGVNGCAGFSYLSSHPGLTVEHTCAGLNRCHGISCVELPRDAGRTGKQVYEGPSPAKGVQACTTCHAAGGHGGWNKFKLYLPPGSRRNASNWQDYPAAAQARIVAFGKQGLLDDGQAYANMPPYHKTYSRAEIERAVEYIRTRLEVVPTPYVDSD